MKNSRQLIDNYNQGITDILKPKLNELKREGDSRISLASEKRKKIIFIIIYIKYIYTRVYIYIEVDAKNLSFFYQVVVEGC